MIGNSNYILVPAFARTELNLTGNELLLYSLIYGFSQDGSSYFTGTLGYMSEWIGSSKSTVQRTLKSLIDKGFLEKDEVIVGGNSVPRYKALVSTGQNDHPLPKMGTPYPKWNETIPKMGTNNIYNNNNNINIYIPTLREVREYVGENDYSIDPEYFISYYSAKGWMLGRNPMTDWKAAVDSWESIQIKKEIAGW